jgi:hypothetical protein
MRGAGDDAARQDADAAESCGKLPADSTLAVVPTALEGGG